MGLLSIINSFSDSGLLKNPGDSFSAKITKTGKQVVTLDTDIRRTAVRYPSTGTIVETIVRKTSK